MSTGLLSACLFLLLDASGSVDAAEHKLQREATAAALTSPEFLARVEYEGGIAVAVAEFSTNVTLLSDWVVIRAEPAARVLAETLVSAIRSENGSTAVGDAVLVAGEAFRSAPGCERRVIDVSSDGRTNTGVLLEEAVVRVQLVAAVQVNALVIEEPTEPGLLDYYRDAVNGFALPATWETYAQSLKMKMTLEIANAPRVFEPDAPPTEYRPFGHLVEGRWGFVYVENPTLVEVQHDYASPRRILDLSNDDWRRRTDVPAAGGAALLAFGVGIVAVRRWRQWR